MTVLEQLAVAVTSDPEWSEMIPAQGDTAAQTPTCQEWSRKGGSHYKDGQFSKK
jgi:hypothetical protein